ncbi:unnamed protein product [Linum trigynum]|uniref:Secreted protein n=1 Tax=Linum trigynum TaxID=586398 RepID=A0AAV2FGV0_9ROSI
MQLLIGLRLSSLLLCYGDVMDSGWRNRNQRLQHRRISEVDGGTRWTGKLLTSGGGGSWRTQEGTES